MKRRSFIATLAAGIAGLFVPLLKSETVFRLAWDGWDSIPMTHGIKHTDLCFHGKCVGKERCDCWQDHDNRYWYVQHQ